ncbi:MAG: hypothetical protein Phog2KO_09620 [Phototrophicaceae bacterium]
MQRLQQGILALFAFAQDVDYELAERYLTPKQMTLFRSMAKSEQLHSLNVLRDVLAQGEQTPQDLAISALMHDVGKSRKHLAVWQKTLSVLVKKLLPQLEQKLRQDGDVKSWRAPFMVREHHPKWGAEILVSYNVSDCVLWLVEHHAEPAEHWQDHDYYKLLKRLQVADDAN